MCSSMSSTLKLLKAVADPVRVRLLLLLAEEEMAVAEVQEILGMAQSRISGHLAQLRGLGLVRDRKAGKHAFYAAREGGYPAAVRVVLEESAREIPEVESDQYAVRVLRRKRLDLTREYFNQLAGRFGRTYCPGRSWESVARMLFSLMPAWEVADLGAGEGTLSQLMAKRARRVIAVDNSENMVAYGRDLAVRHGLTNLEFRLGDLEEPPVGVGEMDLVVLSHALHHAVNPARAVSAAARILKPGGRVVILDLMAHNFEKARELYADRWLGFTEAAIEEWMEAAGLVDREIVEAGRDAQDGRFRTLFAFGVKPV